MVLLTGRPSSSSASALTRRRDVIDSFFSTGTVVRPSRFVARELRAAGRRSHLLAGPAQQPRLRGGTIPTSIALALLMAIWVNDKLRRARSCA